MSTGVHLVGLDFDAVLCGAGADEWRPEIPPAVSSAVVALTALPRARVALISEREIGDLAPRCAGFEPVWMIAAMGRVLVDPGRRMETSPLLLTERLHRLERELGSASLLYVGPLAYALAVDGMAAVPLATSATLNDRLGLLR
jgi:hypothetical protein